MPSNKTHSNSVESYTEVGSNLDSTKHFFQSSFLLIGSILTMAKLFQFVAEITRLGLRTLSKSHDVSLLVTNRLYLHPQGPPVT